MGGRLPKTIEGRVVADSHGVCGGPKTCGSNNPDSTQAPHSPSPLKFGWFQLRINRSKMAGPARFVPHFMNQDDEPIKKWMHSDEF
jgi:hypothetical protein